MRISSMTAIAAAISSCLAVVLPAEVHARPGWGGYGSAYGGGWGDPLLDSGPRVARRDDPREGRVQVSRFIGEGDAASLLGHGAVAVSSQGDSPAGDGPVPIGASDYLVASARAPFEAAVLDRLVAQGYDTVHADPKGGQVAELRVSRDVLVPAEAKRNPVSGSAAMEVGNRGSAYGLALNVDMTKPRSALVSTRLEARIRDRASGRVLWEGHAEIATREGDERWTDGAIATRLAEALFDDFRLPAGDGLQHA